MTSQTSITPTSHSHLNLEHAAVKNVPTVTHEKFQQLIQVPAGETKKIKIEKSGKYTVELTGPGSHADIVGHFLLRGKEKINIELYIIHKSGRTTAQTMLKGVGFDQSELRFFGRIVIKPGCQNVQSFLEERILLLSDKARAEAVPELEILSDDVKCSHAASISRIPEEHLFYLQSRGLSQEVAEGMIVEGFLEHENTTDSLDSAEAFSN